MADNVVANPGSGGATFAADDIGGIHHQRVKAEWGVDGSAVDTSLTDPMPVQRGSKVATGTTISVTDTTAGNIQNNGTPITTSPTAGSFVALQLRPGDSAYRLDLLSGSLGGGFPFVFVELSVNTTNGSDGSWTAARCAQLGTPKNSLGIASLAGLGAYAGPTDGATWIRVRNYNATSTAPSMVLRLASSDSDLSLFSGVLQAGSDVIGNAGVVGSSGTIIADATVEPALNARGLVVRSIEGFVSTGNSTTANLAGGATFTGAWEDVSNFSSVVVNAMASHVSAVDGLKMQQSSNGTDADLADMFTLPAATGRPFSTSVQAKFFRLVYVNGATTTTTLRLQSLYHKNDKKTSSVRPEDGRSNENDFTETLAYLMGYDSTANAWNRIHAVTKGGQGARSLQVQNIMDGGRTAVMFWATGVAAGATGVETAINLVRQAGTAAPASAAASIVPTSGKRLRFQSIVVASRGNATATAQVTTFSLRLNTGGAVVTSSGQLMVGRTATPATALAWDRLSLSIPDGYELLGDGTLQIGMTANSVFTTNAPTWDVLITAFEY